MAFYMVNVCTGVSHNHNLYKQSPLFKDKEQAMAWAEFEAAILLPDAEFEWHYGDTLYTGGIRMLPNVIPTEFYYVDYEVVKVQESSEIEDDAKLAEQSGYRVVFFEHTGISYLLVTPVNPSFKKYSFEIPEFRSYHDCLTDDELSDILEGKQGKTVHVSSVRVKALKYNDKENGTVKKLHPVAVEFPSDIPEGKSKRGKVDEVVELLEEGDLNQKEIAEKLGLSQQRVSQIAKAEPSRRKAKKDYSEFYEAAAELGADTGLPLRARNCLFRAGLLDAWPDIRLDDLQYIRNCGPKTQELIRKAHEIATGI